MEKDLNKIRPEETFPVEETSQPAVFYTKANFEARKKALEKLDKFDQALESAFKGEANGFDKPPPPQPANAGRRRRTAGTKRVVNVLPIK